MITFLHGTLVDKQPTRVEIDVHGVGYEALIPLSSFDRLPDEGASCRLLTVLHVREDSHQLFGFLSEEERRLFVLLTGVTGIGPKLALSVLSGMSIRDFRAAVAEGDVKRLNRIQGVGRKTAERMLVELRDRIDPLEALAAADTDLDPGIAPVVRDALKALIALGFPHDRARAMLHQVMQSTDPPADTETLIKHALASR